MHTHTHSSYLSLNHVRSVQAQVEHCAVDVQRVLGVQLLQNAIQDNEGSSAAHASTGGGVRAGREREEPQK